MCMHNIICGILSNALAQNSCLNHFVTMHVLYALFLNILTERIAELRVHLHGRRVTVPARMFYTKEFKFM